MTEVRIERAFESSIEAHLLAHGWHRVDPATYDPALAIVPADLVGFLRESQPKEWALLAQRLGGEAQATDKVVAYVAKQVDLRGTVDVLRRPTKMNGVEFRVGFFAPANTLTPELSERYAHNRLGVARQIHYSRTDAAKSLDLVLFVNGLPTATAEVKNPLTGQTVRDAMRQYRTDRNPAEAIFRARAVVHFAVDPDQAYMTTVLAGKETRFLPFNQGSGGPGQAGGAGNPANAGGYASAYLWEQVWQRDAWLDLLGSYVHSSDMPDERGKKTGKRTVIFPRFHQWHAVRALLAATRADGPGVDRLVQHSAGSGKSNTIAWLAHSLSRLHTPGTSAELADSLVAAGLGPNEPVFSKVVVITDRVVLDRQLQATIGSFEHTPGVLVRIDERMSAKDLKAALESHTARIVVTTLQKFPVVAALAAESGGAVAGRRFAVVVDEAHSSTSGEAMKDMKSVLTATTEEDALRRQEAADAAVEDARKDAVDLLAESMTARGKHAGLSFFAFTATPKPKTLDLFGTRTVLPDGSERMVPFHLYSMRQAIEEGFILDVLANYTTYATYFKLANAGAEDPEVPTDKASAALARYVSLHPSNLAQKAEVIVEHFRAKTARKIGGHAKAMVVTRSRLHAVRYKQAIDACIAAKGYDTGARPLRALVAFSGTVTDLGDTSYTESFMNGFPESQLPQRFDSDDYQVLVVAEKYQTGYDQPLLHTMYVDKKLAGVKAVQTLSRLNRTHPDKQDTFVLDFANTTEEITEAFRPFFEETAATPSDPNVLYVLQDRIVTAGVVHPDEQARAVAALLSGQAAKQRTVYANLGPAVTRFADLDPDGQDAFRDALRSYTRAYAFLAQVMPWTEADLESLYLYAKALSAVLPAREGEPLPLVDDSVALTHLRIAATAQEADLALTSTIVEPGTALSGGGAGGSHEAPVEPLSVLINSLNQRFGLDLGDADTVWFEQQRIAVKMDGELRTVALHNDKANFLRVLREFAENAIVDRHEANTALFDLFFAQPDFRDRLLDYLAGAYEEIRAEAAELH